MVALATHLLGTVFAIFFTQSSSFASTRSIVVRPERTSYAIRSTKTDADLSQMTVIELKDRLRKLKLPLGGKKDDLLRRLLEYSDEQLQESGKFESKQEDTASSSVRASREKDTEEGSIVYGNLPVPALKERLKKLGLSVGGRKADLIKRLVEFESNANTQTEDDNELEKATDDDLLHIGMSDDDGYDEEEDTATDTDKAESSVRKARRKKFWKTQEVRDLIKANDPSAITKAEEMISYLEQMASEENNNEYLPGPIQYTTLIEAYARSGTADAPQRAEKVINRLLSSSSSCDVSPTTPMLNAIIGAYANMGSESSAEQATAILERMEYIKDQGDGTVKPSVHSFGIVINAWSNVATETAAYNAEEILKRLLEDYDEALEKNVDYAKKIQPNNVVFNSNIDAWARSGSIIAGEKAEAILHRMEAFSRMDKYDVRPDTISFNTCSELQ